MLNTMIPVLGIAIEPRPRFGVAACLHELAATPATARACSARPSTEKSALTGMRHDAALAQAGGAAMQLNGQLPTCTTRTSGFGARIGAMGAGAQGSHPAGEPEPV